ncbi:hypothetical protein LTR53_011080 [Teratosphaeriaceae sp. CCFEE 6253]|nr:hypothetical protein LTR53_011080 [Teratosphaeriaceae sp. CCFEE 6253]
MAGIGIADRLGWTAGFLKSQLLVSIPKPTDDLTGQTILVTGSNTGLGREAARQIVGLGAAKVILAVRTISKGEAAAQDIIHSCNVPPATVEVWQLDMSDPESVKTFAKRTSTLKRLDAAILNAGLLTQKFEAYAGVESHLAVNVIGTLLLMCLLLPVMRRSAAFTGLRGRLSVVGSDIM